MNLLWVVAIGGGIGATLGYFGKCSSGACPLTANWQRGAILGALLGVLFYLTLGQKGSAALDESTPNVTRITEAQFPEQVEQATLPVVVDFYATWCGPCKILSPRLDKLAGEFSGRIKFVKVNVDEAQRLANRFQVSAIPALVLFKNGKVENQVTGLLAEDELKMRLQSLAK